MARNFACSSFLAWTTLILGFLLLLSFLVGGIYYAFLQSNLPEAHLHRLDIKKLNLTKNDDQETLLTANFIVYLNVTNNSEKLELHYGPMTGTMIAQGIKLPVVHIESMRQDPNEKTDMKIQFSEEKKIVEDAMASQMKESAEAHMMVLDVVVKGHMDFILNGDKIQGFPMKIECSAIDQKLIDLGEAPRCYVKITLNEDQMRCY